MSEPESIRSQYQRDGVVETYLRRAADYRNPHEGAVREALNAVLTRGAVAPGPAIDLACGSGEATLTLHERGFDPITGIDPYTGPAYLARTGRRAEDLSFEAIARGALDKRRAELIVCSYALHLCPGSWLPSLCLALARVAPRLIVITPHKKPEIDEAWGWRLDLELRHEEARGRLYRARFFDAASAHSRPQ